jgi:hypothetical protein
MPRNLRPPWATISKESFRDVAKWFSTCLACLSLKKFNVIHSSLTNDRDGHTEPYGEVPVCWLGGRKQGETCQSLLGFLGRLG